MYISSDDYFGMFLFFMLSLLTIIVIAAILYTVMVTHEYYGEVVSTDSMKIISVTYIPSSTHTGVGVGANGTAVTTTSYVSEKNIVMLKYGPNNIKINNEELLNAVDGVGEHVIVNSYKTFKRLRFTEFKFDYNVEFVEVVLGKRKIKILGDY